MNLPVSSADAAVVRALPINSRMSFRWAHKFDMSSMDGLRRLLSHGVLCVTHRGWKVAMICDETDMPPGDQLRRGRRRRRIVVCPRHARQGRIDGG